jgi:hypothetical protein
MDKQLVEQANNFLIGFMQEAGNLKDFVVEQAPEVVQELIMWTIISNCMTAGICLGGLFLFCITALIICFFVHKRTEGLCWLVFMFPLGLGGIPLMEGFDAGKVALKAHYTPKLFLIEYTADLVKGK